MPETIATTLLTSAALYLALGIVFALAFVAKGAGLIDPDARAGTLGFRLLILPGAAALWPLLAAKWRRAGRPFEESSPHRDAAREVRP
jgi:hypothetical protein